MNLWLEAAAVLLFALVPCGLMAFHGTAMERIVGLEMGGMVMTMLLIVLAEGMHRVPFFDLALALALLTFGGGLVFVRFLERWL